MKKSLLVLALALISSTPAYAIQNGTPLNWADHDDMVKLNCSGTVIGGKWVLTAAHCEMTSAGVTTVNGLIGVSNSIKFPATEEDGHALDVSLWKLTTPASTLKATFLSTRPVVADERIRITGFGAGDGLQNLAYTDEIALDNLEVRPSGARPEWLTMKMDGDGYVIGGDSGAPYTDTNGFIVGVSTSGGVDFTTGINAEGARLEYAKDWILDTINGWHYPTLANTPTVGGTITIEVQSLHSEPFLDNATASGDATITGGTCSGTTVEPYGICTYIVSSNGYEGTVTLDTNEVITINKGRTKTTPPTDNGSGSGSSGGGSMGFVSLLVALGLGWFRRKAD